MKSQRAKYHIMLKSNGNDISTESAEEAVDIAEEDMVDKDMNAFCFSKCGYGPCVMKENGREECKELWVFKRKMEE